MTIFQMAAVPVPERLFLSAYHVSTRGAHARGCRSRQPRYAGKSRAVV